MPPHPLRSRRAGSRLARLASGVALAAALLAPQLTAPAQAANPVTPGNFTGFGFDQCLAPTQKSMDAWLLNSPYWAVGIYIAGDSRACRSQPNLTPTWISTQLTNGWRLLPITLGPQASCNPRFPRYTDDVKINPSSAKGYRAARVQGRQEAVDTVEVAKGLGIGPGSTLWYDMEAYDVGNTDCRESALAFTSAWTKKLHVLDYVSGVYSSAASGIKALDDVRVNRPTAWTLPDRIWIADWDQDADTQSDYIRNDGWLPGNRMKQYVGGHDETYGGVTINIDRDFLDLGAGSVPGPEPKHCGGVRLNFPTYPTLRADDTGDHVVALQCLLRWQRFYSGELDGVMNAETRDAVADWRVDHGMPAGRAAGPRVWTSLHSQGDTSLMKYGAANEQVRRLQRALNAASDERLPITGIFEGATTSAVKRYQSRLDTAATGVVTPRLWIMLQSGKV
jgi:peptidoglycan hydrolase-like protein with peptidoglycan-binding domain